MRAQALLTTAAIVLLAPLAACASDPSGYTSASLGAGYGAPGAQGYAQVKVDDGLLPEPPADAHAGQCFAKVVVPGQPIYGPPAGPHLKWVQSPPPPGAVGPVWCQVWEQGYQPTVTYTPERYGWIRVICDKDATRDRIAHIQHRLHDWGVYAGGYGGEYDASTAEAVKRFQAERHIEHGGYLSFRTMEALDAAPVRGPHDYIAPPVAMAAGYGAGPSFAPPVIQQPINQPPVYQAPVYPAPVYQPPIYQQPVYQQPQQPCCAQPAPCGVQPCQGGYGYAGGDNRRWLTWAGKTAY